MNVSFRLVNVILNECVIFWIILSTDLGDQGGLGLIINFSSAMLICELDDILFDSARVHNLKENFNEVEIEKYEEHRHPLRKEVNIDENLVIDDAGKLQVPKLVNQFVRRRLYKSKTIVDDKDKKAILGPEFDDCGFLKVKISNRYSITDHGISFC